MAMVLSFCSKSSTRKPLASAFKMACIIFSSIPQRVLDNVPILRRMVSRGGLQIGLRPLAMRQIPVPFRVLVDPRGLAAAGVIFPGTQLHMSCVFAYA